MTSVWWRSSGRWLSAPLIAAIVDEGQLILAFRDQYSGSILGTLGMFRFRNGGGVTNFMQFVPEMCSRVSTNPKRMDLASSHRVGYLHTIRSGHRIAFCTECGFLQQGDEVEAINHPRRNALVVPPWNISFGESGLIVPVAYNTQIYTWKGGFDRPSNIVTDHFGTEDWAIVHQVVARNPRGLSWMLVAVLPEETEPISE